MMQTKKPAANPLMEIAERIREMREIVGYSEAGDGRGRPRSASRSITAK